MATYPLNAPTAAHGAAEHGPSIPPLPPVVQAAELAALLRAGAGVKLLDVRTPAEFEALHIPGSYNVPLDRLAEHRGELDGSVSVPLVLLCRSGMRARQAESLLRQVDLPQLHVLDGGLAAWEQAGLPIRRGRARWTLERQVRAVAGGLVVAGALGSLLAWRPLVGVSLAVGLGLTVAGVTDTCGMALLLGRLPCNRAANCDIPGAVRALTSGD